MNNQFSQKISEILIYSKQEALRLHNDHVGPEHLLLGLIKDGTGKSIEILQRFYVNLDNIKSEIEAIADNTEKNVPFNNWSAENEIILDEVSARILRLGILEAKLLKNDIVSDEHLLLAILKQHDNIAAKVLEKNDVTYKLVFEQLSLKQQDINAGMGTFEEEDDEEDAPKSNSNASSGSMGGRNAQTQTQTRRPANDTPTIDMFGMDMTKAAEEGKH